MFAKFIFGFLLVFSTHVSAQDTIRVMYYNLLRFPNISPERVTDLRKIVAYVQPDILVVNELLSEVGSELILDEALNANGITHFNAATYVDGPDTDNMLFYNADLLGLVSQLQIPTGLRDISSYKLYYKNPSLAAGADTIFLQVNGMHLKAGSGYFMQRKEEVTVFKYHLNTLANQENIIAGGDMNFYSGNESGAIAIQETGDVQLFDPIDQMGNWSNNASFSQIHTQSTRDAALADGVGGGLDDRFDLIFISGDIFDNSNGLQYIDGSYQALGQDGARFNQSINVPFNPTVPDSIAEALFYMSDHLPVILDLKTDYTASLVATEMVEFKLTYHQATSQFNFNQQIEKSELRIYDLTGKLIQSHWIEGAYFLQVANPFPKGIYIWEIINADQKLSGKIGF